MQARIFAIAAALMLSAAAAQANPNEGDRAIAPKTSTASVLSRAQVEQQLATARQGGTMEMQGDKVAVNAYEMGSGKLSRVQVEEAAHQALISGRVVEGQ